MDIQFTEAWYSPKSKNLYCLYVKNPQIILHYGVVQVVNFVIIFKLLNYTRTLLTIFTSCYQATSSNLFPALAQYFKKEYYYSQSKHNLNWCL